MDHYINLVSKLDPIYKVMLGLGALIPLVFGIFSWPFFIFIVAPVLFKFYVKYTCGKVSSNRRLDGQVVIVTGSNVGIGYETAKDLARRGGKVIMACRNVEKANEAADEIKKEVGNADISVMKLDLSSMKSVREFAKQFLSAQTRLDILVNNAGGMTLEKVITEDNLEANFAGNHFDVMRKTGKARIVNVSSMGHAFVRELDLDNLNSEKGFNPDTVYCQTKLANVLFTRELDRRFRAAKITELTVNALHPGTIKTQFFRHVDEIWYRSIFNRIIFLFRKTVEEGAQTQIHLAVAEEVEELSGLYWSDCAETSISKLAQNVKLAKDLWEKSANAVKLTREETIF